MALRTLQLGIVFAIGLCWGPAPVLAGSVGVTEIPLSLHLKDPKDVTVVKGQSATLRCEVRSSSRVEIIWLHNDTPITNNDTRRLQQQDGSLHFPKVVAGKKTNNGLTGEYRCLAKNNVGAILSNVAKLKVASFEKEFSQLSDDLTVPESQPTILYCNIHSLPAAQIQWERNTKPLPHSTRYVPLPTGALLITKTHSSDAGSYRCLATNNLLKKTKHSKIVELSVSSSFMTAEPPSFLPLDDILPNSSVLVGGNINLYCAVTGWPIPTVQWLNNDSIVVGNSSVIQIHNATLQDSGNYTCIAYNSMGRISQKYGLDVRQKPHFDVIPISIAYPSAKTVRLDCEASGMPEPKIFWLKDGQPLTIGGRIKKQYAGLVFSHTFSYDSGIYQCVAVNAVGRVWVAAQLVLSSTATPNPPEYVECRAYDNTSLCLSWQPPANTTAQAYSIYSYYTAMGPEIYGPEFVTNMTYQLANGLNGSTNYTFYVRLYSKIASDQSEKVTCETGVQGKRNLQANGVNSTSVELKWNQISSDFPCDGKQPLYKVQWKKKGRATINIDHTEKSKYLITGLSPSLEYEFCIISTTYKSDNSPWLSFSFTGNNNDNIDLTVDNTTQCILIAPDHVEGNPVSATVINLTWMYTKGSANYYSICYVNVNEQKNCEDEPTLESSTTMFRVENLQANTLYEFKVRALASDGHFSPYSKPIQVRTPIDVPSPVLDLKYKIVNDSAVCLRWQAPVHKNGQLSKYLISYTPDRNWPLEKWYSISLDVEQKNGCWLGDEETSSILLVDLKRDKQYTAIVRAASDIGPGNPTLPIILTTNQIFDDTMGNNDYANNNSRNTVEYNQKLGIIMGVTIAIMCIIFCISCILVRKQCLKNRALARARMAASNNYYPAVAHYASEGSAVQVRLEDPCSAEVHEIEHLVGDDYSTHIPTIATHLDTKGVDGFPNGHINGSTQPHINGNVQNGGVHITENPRYYIVECNGHADKKNRNHFEEDTNSNLKTAKFQDFHRFMDNNTKKSSGPKLKTYECNPHLIKPNNGLKDVNSSLSSSEDGSLNSTQLTCLDNSLMMSVNRRISPILGPNG